MEGDANCRKSLLFPFLRHHIIMHKRHGAAFVQGQICIPIKYMWIILSRK